MTNSLNYQIWQMKNADPFRNDPRVYNEYISDSVYLLLTQSTVERALTVKNCASRIARIPEIVKVAQETLGNPPRVILETALRQNRGSITFYESGIYELAGETPQLSEIKPVADKAVVALKGYQKFSKRICYHAPTANGASARKNSPKSWSWNSIRGSARISYCRKRKVKPTAWNEKCMSFPDSYGALLFQVKFFLR